MSYIGSNPKLNSLRHTPQSADPSNPSEGQVFYSDGTSRDEGLWVYKDTAWEKVGSGTGGINYIEANAGANSNTTGWNTYDDGAVDVPVDGTAGSATAITFSRNTSNPLRGEADFDLAKSAADGQGEGVSFDFTIDNADKNSIIRISFDYTTSANYADGDLAVFVYDVTNTTLLRLSKESIDATSLQGHFLSEFQASDSTSYRLIFHVTSTNATAYDFNFDNVVVGPRSITRGAVVTDWEDYTPASGWTGSVTHKGKYRRVGDSIELQIATVCTGAPTGTYYTVDLPTGLTIDTAKLNNGINTAQNSFGHAFITDAGTAANRQSGHVYAESTNSLSIIIDESSTVQATSPITFTTNDQVKLVATVPIEGWSSNMTISEDFGGRKINVDAGGNGGTSITANVTNFDWTEISDTTGSWDGTTFTAPETGEYVFSGCIRANAAVDLALNAYKNGSNYRRVFTNNGDTHDIFNFSATIPLDKGDTLSFRSTVSMTLTNTADRHWLHIHKVQSPQTLAGGTLTEHARFNTHGGYGSTNTRIPYFSTEVTSNVVALGTIDHNNATSGFSFTASRPCRVSASWTFEGSGGGTSIGWSLNSSQLTTDIPSITAADRIARATTSGANHGETVNCDIILEPGDVLRPHGDAGTVASTSRHHLNITVTSL